MVLKPNDSDATFGSLGALKTLSDKVDKLSAGAAAWLNVEGKLAYAQRRVNEIQTPTGNPCADAHGAPDEPIVRAQDELCDIYRELWEQTGASEAASEELGKRVTALLREIDDLRPRAGDEEAVVAELEAAADGQGARTLGKRGVTPGDWQPGGDWKQTWRSFVNAGRRRRAALWILAVVLAVATGLNTLYVGKAFGSWWDYLALFLWGVSTKFIVDLVANGLDSLGLSGLRTLGGR